MRIKIDDENYIDVVELMKGPMEIYNLELMHFMYFCQILSNWTFWSNFCIFLHLGIKLENVLNLD